MTDVTPPRANSPWAQLTRDPKHGPLPLLLLVLTFGKHRGLLLRNACGLEFVLVAVALVITLMTDDDKSRSAKVAVAALGAVSGALLVLHTRLAWALALALLLLGVVTITAALQSRRPATWQAG